MLDMHEGGLTEDSEDDKEDGADHIVCFLLCELFGCFGSVFGSQAYCCWTKYQKDEIVGAT